MPAGGWAWHTGTPRHGEGCGKGRVCPRRQAGRPRWRGPGGGTENEGLLSPGRATVGCGRRGQGGGGGTPQALHTCRPPEPQFPHVMDSQGQTPRQVQARARPTLLRAPNDQPRTPPEHDPRPLSARGKAAGRARGRRREDASLGHPRPLTPSGPAPHPQQEARSRGHARRMGPPGPAPPPPHPAPHRSRTRTPHRARVLTAESRCPAGGAPASLSCLRQPSPRHLQGHRPRGQA